MSSTNQALYKAPDRSAPRFRPSKLGTLNKAYIKQLRMDHPKSVIIQALSDKQVKVILHEYHKILIQDVCAHYTGVELPERIGELSIVSCPTKSKDNVDYKRSFETGKLVTYKNLHTDGRLCKVYYSNIKNKYLFKHAKLWGFTAVRDFKKKASEAFVKQHTAYKTLEPLTEQYRNFRKAKREDLYKKYMAQYLLTYNELDL